MRVGVGAPRVHRSARAALQSAFKVVVPGANDNHSLGRSLRSLSQMRDERERSCVLGVGASVSLSQENGRFFFFLKKKKKAASKKILRRERILTLLPIFLSPKKRSIAHEFCFEKAKTAPSKMRFFLCPKSGTEEAPQPIASAPVSPNNSNVSRERPATPRSLWGERIRPET